MLAIVYKIRTDEIFLKNGALDGDEEGYQVGSKNLEVYILQDPQSSPYYLR
jgi:hypothetical protein